MFTQDIDNIDVDQLASQVEQLAADRDRYSAIVRERVAGFRRQLKEAIVLSEILGQ
jgi:outer membrane murein-binding lipoprotein Lpp